MQLFHICYPVAYPDGQEEMLKWSFICPNQTIFDQVSFQLGKVLGRYDREIKGYLRTELFYILQYCQANLVCSFPLDAIPCEEAPNLFDGPDSINSRSFHCLVFLRLHCMYLYLMDLIQ